jgi:YbgC/YbaW family acyl-CoA thioester hydrolase
MISIAIETPREWVEPVYDHVHHSRCFFLFEQARTALLEKIGLPYDRYLQSGLAAVVGSVQAAYKRELKGGGLTVTCDGVERQGRSLVFIQRILNEKGKVAIDARIELVFMDLKLRRAVQPPAELLEALGLDG